MRTKPFLGGLLALLFGVGSLSAAEVIPIPVSSPDPGVSFSLTLPANTVPNSGFSPLRLRISNVTGQAHQWNLQLDSDGSSARADSSWRIALTVEARQTREWELLVPQNNLDNPDRYSGIQGALTGYGLENGRAAISFYPRYPGGHASGFVAMSQTLAIPSWAKLETALSSIKSSSPASTAPLPIAAKRRVGSGLKLRGSGVQLSEMPADWRSFSGFSGLWLSQKDWAELSSDRRRAIRSWINAGGQLSIGLEGEELRNAQLLPETIRVQQTVPMGFGRIHAFQLENGEIPLSQTAEDIFALDQRPFPARENDFALPWPLYSHVGSLKVNLLLVLGFLCVFCVIVGPVNLRVFAPPERRSRLFFTVPLISLLACGALALTITLGDGFGGVGARITLVHLPAGEGQASIVQEQIARTRLLVNRSFPIPANVQLARIPLSTKEESVSLERSGDLASGDWFRSRSVQAFALRSVVPSRAEVVLQPGPDGTPPSLLSSVGQPLLDLIFCAQDGTFWKIPRLDTGRPATLQSASKQDVEQWKKRTAQSMSLHMQSVLQEIINRPGYFYASASNLSEGPIPTLPSIEWTLDTVLCFGSCEKGPAR